MSEDTVHANQMFEIDTGLARRVQEELGQNVYLCYQCLKCTSGCPLSEFFDYQPHQVMRSLQYGLADIALESKTTWLCAACQTCSTRCPQNLDITAIMEFLTREALDRGIKPQIPEADIFTRAFMNEVRLWGRSYELGLMVEIKLRTGNLFEDLDLGMKMLQKGKFPLLPHPSRPPKKVTPVQPAGDAVAYYPGCSLHATSPEYHVSAESVCDALGIELIEPDGWICCGSSAAHRRDPEAALRYPMENLRVIEQMGLEEVVMPCAACFNRHKAAQFEVRHHSDKQVQVEDWIGYRYKDDVVVSSLSQMILQHSGTDRIKAAAARPLKGLKVACYYGCLLTRPPEITEVDHPENPTDLDELIKALGAEVVDWSYKTACCGASHSLVRPDIARNLSKKILTAARQAGADVVAVACPLCHTNLDARQFQMEIEKPLPVLFFTQLMGLAFDLPEKEIALKKNLVDPYPLLDELGFLD